MTTNWMDNGDKSTVTTVSTTTVLTRTATGATTTTRTTTTTTTTTTPRTLVIDTWPTLDINGFTLNNLQGVVVLGDGSFICYSGHSSTGIGAEALRLVLSDNRTILRVVTFYHWHKGSFGGLVERDNGTIITRSEDGTLKEWSIATGDCLKTHTLSIATSMIKTKDNERLVCGLNNGAVEVRRLSDLGLVSYFKLHFDRINCICELQDGSLVSGSDKNAGRVLKQQRGEEKYETLKRWNDDGTIVQTYAGHQHGVTHVIELNRNVIVSGCQSEIKTWSVASGECLHTLDNHIVGWVASLVKLSDSMFAGGISDKTITVWNDNGERVETIRINGTPVAMTKLGDGFLLIGYQGQGVLQIRRLKCVMISSSSSLFVVIVVVFVIVISIA